METTYLTFPRYTIWINILHPMRMFLTSHSFYLPSFRHEYNHHVYLLPIANNISCFPFALYTFLASHWLHSRDFRVHKLMPCVVETMVLPLLSENSHYHHACVWKMYHTCCCCCCCCCCSHHQNYGGARRVGTFSSPPYATAAIPVLFVKLIMK